MSRKVLPFNCLFVWVYAILVLHALKTFLACVKLKEEAYKTKKT